MNFQLSLVIGTRSSALAVCQSQWVQHLLLKEHPHLAIELKKIKTTGDKLLDAPLVQIGGKGAFTSEIEQALLKKEIDLAVHSTKDLPTKLAQGLVVGAVLKRDDVRDVLVTNKARSLETLPEGSRIGTSSLRRKAVLASLYPKFKLVEMRGNVDTRLKKLDEGQVDALVLASSGLQRLGLQHRITEFLDPEVFFPAIGQGALLIERREHDVRVEKLIFNLNHPQSALIIEAERAFLETLEGGCQVPAGCFSSLVNGQFKMVASLFSPDGKQQVKKEIQGQSSQASELGKSLARHLLEGEGKKILNEIRKI